MNPHFRSVRIIGPHGNVGQRALASESAWGASPFLLPCPRALEVRPPDTCHSGAAFHQIHQFPSTQLPKLSTLRSRSVGDALCVVGAGLGRPTSNDGTIAKRRCTNTSSLGKFDPSVTDCSAWSEVIREEKWNSTGCSCCSGCPQESERRLRYRQHHRPIVSLPRFCFDALIVADSIGITRQKGV